jgi:hypothetical protein
MGRPSTKAAAKKKRIVLAVLRAEMTVTEAARRESVSATLIANWRDLFVVPVAAARLAFSAAILAWFVVCSVADILLDLCHGPGVPWPLEPIIPSNASGLSEDT